MTILTITPEAWYIAGISPCVVFAILVLLVLVLVGFGVVAKRANSHQMAGVKAPALSGVITIKNTQSSNWHAVLNPRF